MCLHDCPNRSRIEASAPHRLLYEDLRASDVCVDATWRVLCPTCRPGPGVCVHLCDEWLEACSEGMYTLDMRSSHIKPCHPDSLICSPLHLLANTGTDLCHANGIATASFPDCDDGNTLPSSPFIPWALALILPLLLYFCASCRRDR